MSDELLVRYLLDEVSDEDRRLVELRFLGDEESYQRLLLIEDELRCAHARGTLSADRRRRFEERLLLVAQERENAAVARAMIEVLSEQPVRSRGTASYTRLAVAAVAVLAIAAVSWQAFDARRLRQQLATLQSDRASFEQETRTRTDRLERELEDERRARGALEQALTMRRDVPGQRPSTGAMLSLFLAPGRLRSGGTVNTITLTSGTTTLQLLLSVPGITVYPKYQAEMVNSSGRQVWSGDSLASDQAIVIAPVPAGLLAEDDYEVTLRGLGPSGAAERVASYPFRVLR